MSARNIRLREPEFGPKAPSWRKAPKQVREQVWRKIGEFAQAAYRRQIMKGLGADGEKLAPVKPASRPDRATGPPLIPHRTSSRTYDLLSIHATSSGCTLFWKADRGSSWATILTYHADGLVRGAPVRDVIGLAPQAIREVQERTATYWRTLTRQEVERPSPPRMAVQPQKPPVAQDPIARAVRVAEEAGVAIDPRGAQALKSLLRGETSHIMAAYHYASKTIYINETHEVWTNPGAMAAKMKVLGGSGWLSSEDPLHIVHHEIAHAKHFETLRETGQWEFKNGTFPEKTREELSRRVSRYGSTSAAEFVAEVYAGRKAHRLFDDEVLDLYRKLKGPPL